MSRTLRKQALSMRGEPVDFGALAAANQSQITLGNTKTNVRGDKLGDNGVVLKTQEQIEAEWAQQAALSQHMSRTVDAKQFPKKDVGMLHTDMEFPSVQDLVKDGVIPPVTTKKPKA